VIPRKHFEERLEELQLAIVKHIAIAHRGRVDVVSAPADAVVAAPQPTMLSLPNPKNLFTMNRAMPVAASRKVARAEAVPNNPSNTLR
jgi:hypothetical protein